MTNTRLYNIYVNMIRRCYDPKSDSYFKYGKVGITVCEEWRNSNTIFFEWALKNNYSENLTIDRINNLSGYSPENCRWATVKQQNSNKKTNKFLTFNGKTQTVKEWEDELKIRLNFRLKNGWSIEDALTTPMGVERKNKTKQKHEEIGVIIK